MGEHHPTSYGRNSGLTCLNPDPPGTAPGLMIGGAPLLAYDFPLLSAFWTMLVFFLWIAWFFLLFKIVADVFRDHTLSGVAKVLWLIFLLFLPFLGAFVYIIARGNGMTERDIAQAKASEAAFQSYVRDAAGTGGGGGAADQLEKLAGLRDRGVLTEEEFAAQKAKILG
jgi:hypothetical protein